jgi:hypothetical protein
LSPAIYMLELRQVSLDSNGARLDRFIIIAAR